MSKLVGISGVSGCGCQGVGNTYAVTLQEGTDPAAKRAMQLDLPMAQMSADVMAATRIERLAITGGLAVLVIGGMWLATRK